ncbi:MAG: ATP-grasp domain-containing protein [Proteobacteria bacterium]|nr:ATP-grasp domain-containing protein [Pseudomonadota bacterium]
MNGPTVMVLGAGRAIVKSVAALKAAGFRTVVVDDLPQPFAFEVADVAVRCAVDDVDGLDRIVAEHGAHGAVATNEAGVCSIAELAARGVMRGGSRAVAARLASKLQQRETINAGCPDWQVPFRIVASAAEAVAAGEALGWPLILKPELSGGGSRGVSLAAGPEAADEAFAFAFAETEAKGSAILAEQALDGPQFSAEVLVAGGRAEVIAIGRKRKSRAPWRVDLAVIYPGLEGEARAEAERMLREVVLALGVADSPAHVEFAMTARGPRPIEVGGRVGGGFTSLLAAHASGCDPFVQAARVACGLPPQWPDRAAAPKGAVYGFLTYPPGQATGFTIPPSVAGDPHVLDAFLFLPADGMVKPLQWTSQRVGMMAVTGETAADAVARFEALSREVTVDYADGASRPPLTDNAE